VKKITTLIVDDEFGSRKTLHNFLVKYCPEVEVVAEAASVEEAVAAIKRTSPELVFLDINMPDEDGFELFNKIPQPDFYTVFVTAYDEYSLRAFKHHALDYILKPIDINELTEAVGRILKLQNHKEDAHRLKSILQTGQQTFLSGRIALPVSDGLAYVQVNDIIRCEAEGSYTNMYFTNRTKIVVCRSLGIYEDLLKEHGFARVHHQHLINLKHVERYRRGRGGIVFMSDKKEIDVSQRKKDEFLKLLGGNHAG
jgi:two-component system LytT family response regulator